MAGMTARFGPTPVEFEGTLYDGQITRTISFAAPMELGEADLVAALWLATCEGGLTAEDMAADPLLVRQLATEAIVNDGLDQVHDARVTVAGLPPDSVEHAWAQQLVAAVRGAFASVLARPAALVEVA